MIDAISMKMIAHTNKAATEGKMYFELGRQQHMFLTQE